MMRHFIFLGLFVSMVLSGCTKQKLKKFEGTYSDAENQCNPEVILTKCSDKQICFDFKFGCYYIANIKANLDSKNELKIEPIPEIGVMSQGGYELFGGKVHKDDDKLTIEIEYADYCDPNDPPFINCVTLRETVIYKYTKK